MLTAVVKQGASGIEVSLTRRVDAIAPAPRADEEEGDHSEGDEAHHAEVDCEFPFDTTEDAAASEYPCEEGPSPILPEAKELLWGGGAFLAFLVLMRFFLYPKLRKGMDARYAKVQDGFEQADAARAAARAEVTEYEAALATVRAEAAERVDAARATLAGEREARLAEVHAEISSKRDAAMAEARAAREAAESDVRSAVTDVTSKVLEMAIGRAPTEQVEAAVADVMNSEVRS
ncbi:MAG: hypothetical protein KDB37_14765 [Ilumatobacter sp.]|nr:hypothetical protein [Ilumatobacter sp.]